MSRESVRACLVTPLPPMRTGLATYALRVLENTRDLIDWTVAHTRGSDPASLPGGLRALPVDDLANQRDAGPLIFQVGNSPHCYDIVRALYRHGGTVVFHETVLHHMLRECHLAEGRIEEYRRELVFCYGPAARSVEAELSREGLSAAEFDRKLKSYPLIGRAVHASRAAVCLNPWSASLLTGCYPEGGVITIGHPLSPLPDLPGVEKPFETCLGMVGGNSPCRNLDILLKAVEEVRKKMPGVGLVLAGAGYPDDLPEWTVNTGRLEEPLYQSWIRTMDIVLDIRHPSCGETSGSLLEAMRAGVPPIVAASGSFINIPSDAVMRIPPDNLLQSLPAAVMLLLEDGDLMHSLSRAAKDHAEDTGSTARLLSDWRRVIALASSDLSSQEEGRPSVSLSPAWTEPPQGFRRDIENRSVAWAFTGEAILEGPPAARGAAVTVRGDGSVNGMRLSPVPSVIEVAGRDLVFSGSGRVFSVYWHVQ